MKRRTVPALKGYKTIREDQKKIRGKLLENQEKIKRKLKEKTERKPKENEIVEQSKRII